MSSGTLAPEAVRQMFDRVSPVYDLMNRVLTAGLDGRWRRLTAAAVVRPGDRVLDACCGTGDLALADLAAGGEVTALDFSERMLERARSKSDAVRWVRGDAMALPFEAGSFDAATVGFGIRNVSDLEAGFAELARVLSPGGRLGCLEITQPRRAPTLLLPPLVRPLDPARREGASGRGRLHLSPSQRAPLSGPAGAHGGAGALRFCRRQLPAPRGRDRHPPHRQAGMSALATIPSAPGLESYLERLELRLEQAVALHPGLVGDVGAEILAAGGKRLRPALVYLATPPKLRSTELSAAAGAAVELIHMATLVHDDLIDGAELRRGRPTVWATYGEEAAKAAGDYLFARAFTLLALTGDRHGVQLLAGAALSLARGEALQRRQAFRTDTSVDDYLARCSLKTGKLFEAACLLGRAPKALGEFGLSLGIAFQIVDDILDCAGEFDTTGKAPGLDLREGTPTLPLILAARTDDVVRRALAGEPVEDALDRVAGTGALGDSRAIAREYAERARAALDGAADHASLEALTYVVVERES